MKPAPGALRRRVAPGGRIDRYVGSIFISSYATSLLMIVGLVFIGDLAQNLDNYLEGWPEGSPSPAGMVVRFYVLNLPFLFLQSAPFITLVAGVFTVSRLLKHNELAACMAAGSSARRIVAPLFLGGAVAGAGAFALREWMADTILPQRDALLYSLQEHELDRVYDYLWLRNLDGSVVRLGEFRPAVGDPPVAEVRDLEAFIRDGDNVVSIEADRAVYATRDGEVGWYLEGGVLDRTGDRRETRTVDWLEGFEFSPSLALSYHRARTNPLELSFGEAVELARRDPDNVVYQTLMQYHLTFSLANVVLLMVGLPLLLRHERGKGVEGLAASLLLCVFFFGADFIFRNLGVQGALDPLVASWAPVLLFGSLGVVLLDTIRT